MLVTTTADKAISDAKDHISCAYRELLTVLDESTWGHDQFVDGYIEKVSEVAMGLLKLKRQL